MAYDESSRSFVAFAGLATAVEVCSKLRTFWLKHRVELCPRYPVHGEARYQSGIWRESHAAFHFFCSRFEAPKQQGYWSAVHYLATAGPNQHPGKTHISIGSHWSQPQKSASFDKPAGSEHGVGYFLRTRLGVIPRQAIDVLSSPTKAAAAVHPETLLEQLASRGFAADSAAHRDIFNGSIRISTHKRKRASGCTPVRRGHAPLSPQRHTALSVRMAGVPNSGFFDCGSGCIFDEPVSRSTQVARGLWVFTH